MRTLWLVTILMVSMSFPEAFGGQESKGALGLRIKLLGALELGNEVQLWDKVTNSEEILPTEQPAYIKIIEPQLTILKGKLPRLGHRLETLFKRGINPTWYLVNAELKKQLEAPQTDLILTFERVQVALHDGQTIRINKELLNKMPLVEQGWTYMHEVLRSAVEVSALQDDAIIGTLNSVIMHKNLANFEKKELAKRLLYLLRGGERIPGFFDADTEEERRLFEITKRIHDKLGPESPLIKLIEADLKVALQDVGDWEDHSTLPDGLSGTNCIYETDQCVFRDKKRGPIYWSAISPGEKSEDIVKNFDDTKGACQDLKNWGGYSDWRLPTISELFDLSDRINAVVKVVTSFGQNNNVFLWAATSPSDSPWWLGAPQKDTRAWAINLASTQYREFDKQALNEHRCTRDDYDFYWVDASTDANGQKNQCSKAGDECAVIGRRSQLVWSAPSPRYEPKYAKHRSPDDLGYVSLRTAQQMCRGLTWAGVKGWRLPSPREAFDANRDGFFGWSAKFEQFGLLLGSFWMVEPDPNPNDIIRGFYFDEGTASADWRASEPYKRLRRYICVHDVESEGGRK